MHEYLHEKTQEEREAMHGEVMAKLRAFCDSRRLSVSFVDVRYGITEGTATDRLRPDSNATLLDKCLIEIERCAPYFICLLGQVYGDVPRKLPGYSKETHPWLSDFRYFNKAVTFGCRMSITEMEVLSACLVDETYCKHARFFMREPSYTASKDSSFRDIEDWERSAMNNFTKKISRAVELSAENDAKQCMMIVPYHNPSAFAKILLNHVTDICDMQHPTKVPNANELFWMQLDSEFVHRMRWQSRKTCLHLEHTASVVNIIQSEMNDDLRQGRRILITGAHGSGKSAVLARWFSQKVQFARQLENIFQKTTKQKVLQVLEAFSSDSASRSQCVNVLQRRNAVTPGKPDPAVAFCKYENYELEKVVVMIYLHAGVHHRIRHGTDLIRALILTLYNSFDLDDPADEHLFDDRLSETLLRRLGEFSPEKWTLFFVLDGSDRVGKTPAINEWLPKTKQSNVHWLLSTSDAAQISALSGHHMHEIAMPQLTNEQRRDLLSAGLSRNNTPHNEDMIHALITIPLSDRPEFLVCSLDLLRLCSRLSNAEATTTALASCSTMEACYETILRKWTADVAGAKLTMSLLCLSATGLYEYELVHLLRCPTELSTHDFLRVCTMLEDVKFSSCGVWKIFNVNMFATFKKKLLDKEFREDALHRLERYFGSLPTCNRKLDEYVFVLEKLKDWKAMYTYVTDITIFHQMYSDPVRKQQFLSYTQILQKSSEELQYSLRKNFEDHFSLSKRWFCNGDAFYYELNAEIYKSRKRLLSFQEIVFTLSSFFELHGRHEECIRDLESSLKALFGVSDLYAIPNSHPEKCVFPLRVGKIMRRLCHLYALHLEAMVEHWFALDDDGAPKRQIPKSVCSLDVSWWATPVPAGAARTLPQKLKLMFAINVSLSHHYLGDINLKNMVSEILELEAKFGHFSKLEWNTGQQCFMQVVEEEDQYGKTKKDPASLKSLPLQINHPSALIPGFESKRGDLYPILTNHAKSSFVQVNTIHLLLPRFVTMLVVLDEAYIHASTARSLAICIRCIVNNLGTW